MSLLTDLTSKTNEIVSGAWKRRDGQVVPESEDLALGNEGADFKGRPVLTSDRRVLKSHSSQKRA